MGDSSSFYNELKSLDMNDKQQLLYFFKKNSGEIIDEYELSKALGYTDPLIEKLRLCLKRYARIIIKNESLGLLNMPIDMAIATLDQSKIRSRFDGIAERFGFDESMQLLVDEELEDIAFDLNRRFVFDESSLIHLIEASKGSNIQLEEDYQRTRNNIRQILRQKKDGTYHLADVDRETKTGVYTTGKVIPVSVTADHKQYTDVDEQKNVMLSAYPNGQEASMIDDPSKAMQEVMSNLFDNLELCTDLYKFYYTNERTGNIDTTTPVRNEVLLSDDSTFEFYYNINKKNLPHLLGIPKGEKLSDAAINFFSTVGPDGQVNYPVKRSSNSFDVLKAILDNKERIIACGGLIEEDGKQYQILPWEKIVLKTSSFIRGDFFKTCFCLVKLQFGFNSPNEEYATIAPTKYDDAMTNDNFNAKAVLRSLIASQKQTKDFVFRTFVRSGSTFVPQSIDTGKAETIILNGSNERLRTLERFRKSLIGYDQGHSGAATFDNINNIAKIPDPINNGGSDGKQL